jgi:hypothetical protein
MTKKQNKVVRRRKQAKGGSSKPPKSTAADPKRSWRNVLPVHPAADLFPLMTPTALRELADDIAKHGMREPAAFLFNGFNYVLLDGRNRLDALELLGVDIGSVPITHCRLVQVNDDTTPFEIFQSVSPEEDPVAYVISKNIHRRHLTAGDKRRLIGDLLKLNVERSDRQIGAMVGADHKTVGSVRSEKEGRGEIPHVTKRADARGRKQPSRKTGSRKKVSTTPPTVVDKIMDDALGMPLFGTGVDDPAASGEKQKAKFAALEEQEVGSASSEPSDPKQGSGVATDQPEAPVHKSGNGADSAQQEFDGHLLRLFQMTKKAKAARFVNTAVPSEQLEKLHSFIFQVYNLKGQQEVKSVV